MFGFISPEERGASDRLLAGVATRLQAEGVRLAGAVQVNVESGAGLACEMNLRVLAGAQVIRISQRLGSAASGCRLDPDGLERAVALVQTALAAGPERAPALIVVNKFGRQEAEGRGFRPLIGEALALGVPVLTAVGAADRAAFVRFADGLAEPLPPDPEAVLAWCRRQLADRPVPG